MAVLSAFKFTLLFAVFFVNSSCAQNLTVYLNDTTFVTAPQNWWGRPDYPSLCGGSRWTSQSGQNISLTFTGTAVAINFILENAGAIAQVSLDGADVAHVNTFVSGVPDSACAPFAWDSGDLSQGQHTVTVTQLGSGNPANPSVVYVWMTSFVYTAASDPPANTSTPDPTDSATTTSTTSSGFPPIPSQSGKTSPGLIAGAVAGGVIVVLLLVVGTFFIRRQKKRSSRSLPRLLIDGDDDDSEKPRPIPLTRVSRSSGQGGVPVDVQQRFHADVMSMMSTPTQSVEALSMMSTPTQSTTLLANPKSWSPAPPSPIQKGTIEKSKMPDNKTLPHTYSPAHTPTAPTQQLTPTQLDFVQKLSDQNVPGPALATVIASLASGGRQAAGGGELEPISSRGQVSFDGEEAPPAYYSKGT